jgi:hypothetical protein
MDKLVSFAKTIGLKEFETGGQIGRRLGYYSPSAKKVVRFFATGRETLAHEVGHFFDDKYGLKQRFYRNRKATRDVGREMHEFSKTEKGESKNRLKKPEEIFANAFSWWLTHRDLAKQSMPKFSQAMEEILSEIPDLKPLLNIKPTARPSVEQMTQTVFGKQMALKPNEIGFKINGVWHRITTKQEIARALKAIKLAQVPELFRWLRTSLNLFKTLVTKYSPNFLFPTNPQRDIGEAFINIAVERGMLGKAGKGLRTDFIKGVIPAQRALWKHLRGKVEDETVAEFLRLGGDSGHFWSEDYIEASENLYQLEKQIKNEGFEKVKNILRNVDEVVDEAQRTVELATRFSAYKAFIKHGMSKQNAISAVADLTINFSRQGEASPILKTFIAFIQPAIAGTSKTIRVISSKRGRLAIATSLVGMMSVGFITRIISMMMGGDDDEDISDWAKNHKLIIAVGDKKAVTVWNYPYGWSAFPAFGSNMAEFFAGKKTLLQVFEQTFSTAAQSFSPEGGVPLVPTLAKPYTDIKSNISWSGGKIHPERYPNEKKKNHELYWKDTNGAAVAMAGAIYRLTGLDVYPNDIEYLASFYTGGLPKFVVHAIETGANTIKGDFVPNTTPVANQFYRELYDKKPKSGTGYIFPKLDIPNPLKEERDERRKELREALKRNSEDDE